MNFDIAEVMIRAWKITWKYKVLWVFGMFASCGRGNGGGNGSGGGDFSSVGDPTAPGGPFQDELFDQMAGFVERAINWFTENPWLIPALAAALLVLLLVQIFLSIVGSVGLIRGVNHAEAGVERIAFAGLFHESLRYFWRVIGLTLAMWLPVLAVVSGTLAIVILSVGSSPDAAESALGAFVVLFLVGFCCCLLPFMIVLGIYFTQAKRALVLEDLGILASLARAWEVFRRNILGLLIVAVILFIINLTIGLAVSIPVYIAVFPLMLGFINGTVDSWQPVILTGVLILLYSPIAWLLGGIALAYTEAIWTLTYLRAAAPKESPPALVESNA
jgi:hypothetical protein